MKKTLLFTVALLFASFSSFGQNTWFDTDNSITGLTFSTDCEGCSISTVANPDASDTEATNVLLWKIDASDAPTIENKKLIFNFSDNLAIKPGDYASLQVTVRLYFPSHADFDNYDSSDRFRFYLGAKAVQLKLAETNEAGWFNLVFDFSTLDTSTVTSDVLEGDIRLIGQANRFTNLDNGLEFYIDTITATVAPTLSVESEVLESNTLKFLSNNVENTLEVSRQIKSATIYNNLGVALKTFKENTQFDVSNLSTGLYIFHAKLDNGAEKTLRFLKK
jgi:hypothetical protein